MVTKMTRGNHKNLIFTFPGRTRGFEAVENYKHCKFGHFCHFLALLERFWHLAALKPSGRPGNLEMVFCVFILTF